MFEIDQRVYCTAPGYEGLAHIQDRMRNRDNRVAYIVEFRNKPLQDLVVTGKHLRAADMCCDGCGRWLPNNKFPHEGIHSVRLGDGSIDEVIRVCWYCIQEDKRRMDFLREEYVI